MSITYVSCLYNIYSGNVVSQRLLADVAVLLKQNMRIIMFVDEFYHRALQSLQIGPNVTLEHLPLCNVATYTMIMSNRYFLTLPSQRNPVKDTYEYIALMNSKPEFMTRAKHMCDTPYMAWIDAGCSKLFKSPEQSFRRLCDLVPKNINGVLLPGCYSRDVGFNDLCTNAWWVFLGTFFICKRDAVDKFYACALEILGFFIVQKQITWEVNAWISMRLRYGSFIGWYYALHDDSFTIIPNEFKQ